MSRDMFDLERLPAEVDAFLRDSNPWWEGKPGRVLPSFRRWAFQAVKRKLERDLAPILVLRGPRQVGKTTIQEQIIRDLIDNQRVEPNRILRVQFDDISIAKVREPVLAIARWFENRILRKTFNETAHIGKPAYLFFDEVQNLQSWAPQVKALVDHNSAKVTVTGSSALRIEAGKDSLAGRITQVDLGTLLLREIAALRFGADGVSPAVPENGLQELVRKEFWQNLVVSGNQNSEQRDQAFAAFSERGGYPIVHARPEVPWPEIADQLNETVIQRVIQHDLRLGSKGQKRDKNLLEEVFRLACRYAGQAPKSATYIQQLREALNANIGWTRVLSYLRFLDGALLLKLIAPLELRLKKRKGNHKVCISDHGLRASWLQEVVPLVPSQLRGSPHLADLAGHIAESVVGYFLSGLPHLDIAHFPERPTEPEVDYVLTVGDKRIPLEVKYRQHLDLHRDSLGLRAFIEKTVYNAPFGILVTMNDDVQSDDARIVPVSLPSLLLMR